ncbi:M14 family metallopeptidase [Sinomicrobium sp.]
MKRQTVYLKCALIFSLGAFFTQCSTPKKVSFETPVDTSDKPIVLQTRDTFYLPGLDVYLTNEFEAARLNGATQKNDSTLSVMVTPENEPINRSPYYAFKAWSPKAKKVYVHFQYPEKYKHRYWPKLKEEGQAWKFIDSTQVYKEGKQVTIGVKLDKTPVTIAAQEVQSSTDVRKWYTELVAGKEYVHIEEYGTSKLGRKLYVMDIYKGDKKDKPIVVLLTRQHPPEVTGYFAYQAFLKTLLAESGLSENFLSQYRVLAFPLLNPDGVDEGHWRHNAGGIDTNRDWAKYRQPEVEQAVRYIDKKVKESNGKVVLGLDFHSTYKDVFYTNTTRKGTTFPNFIDDWFKALEANIPNYKVNESSGNSTKPVSKGWFLVRYNAVGITYEIGDNTPRDRIALIGKVTATEMMKLLLAK